MTELKPFIGQIIKYYYEIDGNGAGGSLHNVLDDGNVSYGDVDFCRNFAEDKGDTLGVFICDLLFHFTENERELLYENNWDNTKN